jgi:putative SOS response-associated peptidase YedK
MCTAYEIGQTDFDVDWLVADALEASMFEEGIYRIIRPTLTAPVILPDRTWRIMSWGFRYTPRGQKKPRTVVNSREDQLKIRLWRDKFQSNRCLIPASAFFEWVQSEDGKMMPLRFTRPANKGVLIAGVWGVEEGLGECFSMITTEPTDSIRAIHDRMPAVLANDQLRPFVDGELNEFGPTRVPLVWAPTENFLTRKKQAPPPPAPPEPPAQGELF